MFVGNGVFQFAFLEWEKCSFLSWEQSSYSQIRLNLKILVGKNLVTDISISFVTMGLILWKSGLKFLQEVDLYGRTSFLKISQWFLRGIGLLTITRHSVLNKSHTENFSQRETSLIKCKRYSLLFERIFSYTNKNHCQVNRYSFLFKLLLRSIRIIRLSAHLKSNESIVLCCRSF